MDAKRYRFTLDQSLLIHVKSMTFTPQSPIPPPPEVRGMTEWTPELFSTSALLPRLSVARDQVSKIFSKNL